MTHAFRWSTIGLLLVALPVQTPVAGAGENVDTAGATLGKERTTSGRRWNFETDIVPILSRFGCNSAACHGKAEGQNGFKLSVFGFDSRSDYSALTMEGRGRRVFPAAPERSLLLLKASGRLPHGGGVRIGAWRPEYARLRDWITAGLPWGSDDDPRVARIELSPRQQRMAMGQSQPLKVIATYSDGSRQDVTALAQFQSNREELAKVDEQGTVVAGQVPGTVAVMANYLGSVNVFLAIIPRGETIGPYPENPQHNFIDQLIDRRLRQLNILPSGPADDAAFMRRVYLDLIGTLPSADEARRFLADTRPESRRLLVDELLQRDEFAVHWALKWSDLLRVDRQVLGHKAAYEQYRWIRDSLAAGKPLDQFAREIVAAEGPLAENPQANLYKVVPAPGDAAATISQVFLGVRIQCAQCHHHPYDRWSQSDYYGMQAFFAPLKRRKSPWGEILLAQGAPVARHPRSRAVIYAHALGMSPPEEQPAGDRCAELADWMTAADNPWFARNLANRVWAHLLGRGLVEPVDDFRDTNPPSHPELLDRLAEHLVDTGYDLRELIRLITAARVYGQSTAPNPTNENDQESFSRAALKRLSAEVLLDAVCQATGVPEKFPGVPAGSRAIELWDSQVDHYFLKLFGRPVRKSACECERTAAPSVAQVLHMLNSERVHAKLSHEGGTVARLVRTIEDDSQLVDELYLTYFSRYPTPRERQFAVEHLGSAPQARRQSAEDLAWSMLNSLEFLFNH